MDAKKPSASTEDTSDSKQPKHSPEAMPGNHNEHTIDRIYNELPDDSASLAFASIIASIIINNS